MDREEFMTVPLNSARLLRQIDTELAGLLGMKPALTMSDFHEPDPLMVWVLLGGKDVGKSTLIESVFGYSPDPQDRDQAQGTERFLAHVSSSLEQALRKRFRDFETEVEFRIHEDKSLGPVCILDSPDFDSRFHSHQAMVERLIQTGAVDGVALLSSPAKYKDETYWSIAERLSSFLSPAHLLFVLTKADELGSHLAKVKEDFRATLLKRVQSITAWSDSLDQEIKLYAVDSLGKTLDFPRLSQTISHPHSSAELHGIQMKNWRHAMEFRTRTLRKHYRLNELKTAMQRAKEDSQLEEMFSRSFPDAFFHAVCLRLENNSALSHWMADRCWSDMPKSLAGLPGLVALFRWGRILRSKREKVFGNEGLDDMEQLLRWDNEEVMDRIRTTRHRLLSLVPIEDTESLLAELDEHDGCVLPDLEMEARESLFWPTIAPLRLGLRILLNLPFILYFLLFLHLLFYPLFLLLHAWQFLDLPDIARFLSWDSVRVSLVGFLTYYIMATLYVLRRYGQDIKGNFRRGIEDFVSRLRERLLWEARRPLHHFIKRINQMEERILKAEKMPEREQGKYSVNPIQTQPLAEKRQRCCFRTV